MNSRNLTKKQLLQLLESCEDALQRHQHTAKALRAKASRYRAMCEDIPAMNFIVDAKGKIVSVNRFGANQLGYEVQELVGQSVIEVFHDRDRKKILQQLKKCLQNPEKVHQWQFRKVHKDGRVIWVEEFARAMMGPDGRRQVIIVCEDLTERKQAEEKIKKYNRKLEDRTAKLKAANQKLVREIRQREQTERELSRYRQELQRLSAHLQALLEEERTRMAREIHDELGQVLSSLKMEIGSLQNYLPADQQAAFEIIQASSTLISQTIEKVKEISQELRPSVLDNLPFKEAISWQIDEFARKTGIRCRLSVKNFKMPPRREVATALFRVLQEALTNIYRHAEASQVRVELNAQAENLTMKVKDDGKGMSTADRDDPQSFGLIGMRERLHHLNGHFEIISAPNQGTTILVTVPFANHGE